MARRNTRQLIIDAALRVAAKHGISGASIDLIIEQAGVARGSVYYNFDSKDAIFEEVMRSGFEKLAAAIDTARDQATAEEAPRAVGAATLETLRDNLDLAKLIASEFFRTDRPWAEAITIARDSVTVRYRDVLREARAAAGDLDTDRITEIAGAAFFGSLAAACLNWLIFRPEQPVEHVLDQVLLRAAS